MDLDEIIEEIRKINPWVMDESSVDKALQVIIEELENIER